MPSADHSQACPLCRHQPLVLFAEDSNRVYLRCPHCFLISVPDRYWLSQAEQKATYDLHENDPQDPGYRRFLSRLCAPLLERLQPGQFGLDFGCGPGPALPAMLTEHGHRMECYDPFYFNDPAVFERQYDYICAAEVVEHLQDPDRTFTLLFKMLNPGGWLGIMTKLALDARAFSRWHYIRDMTHICFYSRGTLDFIARRFNARLIYAASDSILLQKSD